jgi:hypothetical protein
LEKSKVYLTLFVLSAFVFSRSRPLLEHHAFLTRELWPMLLTAGFDIFNSLHTDAFGIEYTYYGQLPFNPRRVKTGPTTQDGSADVSLRQQNLRCF